MADKTFFRIAIAIGLTALLTDIKLSSQAQMIPSGSPARQRDGSVLMTQKDADWLGRIKISSIASAN